MNAKRQSERRRRRNSGSDDVKSLSRGRQGRWIVLPLGLLGLVLVLLGYYGWREDPTGELPEAVVAKSNAGGDRMSADMGSTLEAEEAPLPPLFSPGAPAEECKQETMRMAIQLAEDFPDKLDALQTSATIRWALGDMLEAVRLWEECRTRDSRFSPAYEGLGRVSLLEGDFERAVTMFREAIALEPANRQLTMLLAEALVRSNRMEEVVAELAGFIQSGPASPRAFLWLGQAYLELGQYDDAHRALEVALQRMPEERQVHFALTRVYGQLKQPDKAKWHRDKVQQLVDVYREAGKGQVRGSGTPDALYRDAVRAHLDAAAVYHRYGKVDEAIDLCRKAAALDPRDVESRQSLVALYEQAGRVKHSLRIKQQLRDLSRDSAGGPRRP